MWGEEESLFHNKLVKLYQQGVEALLPEYKKAIGVCIYYKKKERRWGELDYLVNMEMLLDC